MYDLSSTFDIEKHRDIYTHYLEAIIFPDGHIEYAIPSHQEKLISICCEKLRVSRQTLYDMCPEEYYYDFVTWLCNISGCISIWTNFMIKSDKEPITNLQNQTITKLTEYKIYEGD